MITNEKYRNALNTVKQYSTLLYREDPEELQLFEEKCAFEGFSLNKYACVKKTDSISTLDYIYGLSEKMCGIIYEQLPKLRIDKHEDEMVMTSFGFKRTPDVYVGDFEGLSISDLMKIRGVGVKFIKEVKTICHFAGVNLIP